MQMEALLACHARKYAVGKTRQGVYDVSFRSVFMEATHIRRWIVAGARVDTGGLRSPSPRRQEQHANAYHATNARANIHACCRAFAELAGAHDTRANFLDLWRGIAGFLAGG